MSTNKILLKFAKKGINLSPEAYNKVINAKDPINYASSLIVKLKSDKFSPKDLISVSGEMVDEINGIKKEESNNQKSLTEDITHNEEIKIKKESIKETPSEIQPQIKVGGEIKKIYVKNGDYVKKGDPICEIDASKEIEADVTIKVDGKVLDSSKYDLAYGSLHITLHGDYIMTLAAGKHTLTTEVTGYATINQDFYIKSKPSPNPGYVVPNTGIEGTYSNNHSLLKLSSLSLLAIGTYLVIKKKKDNN